MSATRPKEKSLIRQLETLSWLVSSIQYVVYPPTVTTGGYVYLNDAIITHLYGSESPRKRIFLHQRLQTNEQNMDIEMTVHHVHLPHQRPGATMSTTRPQREVS